ncbi:MAG: hypothetical protein ACTSRS_19050 [Candidatus Helarchaeota archaeon]
MIHVTKELTLITIEDTVIPYKDPSLISAYLTDDESNPLPGENISLYTSFDGGINWNLIGSSITDRTGKISVQYTLLQPSGYYQIKGVYQESAYYFGKEFITVLIIEMERTEIDVPDVSGTIGSDVDLEATLTDDEGNALAGYYVYFYVLVGTQWEPAGQQNWGITDSNGVATVKWGPIPTATLTIRAEFLGDPGYYFASSGEDHIIPLTIPTLLSLTSDWSGGDYVLQGDLKTQDNVPLSGLTITVTIVSTNYMEIIQTQTATDGTYYVVWTPTDPDDYSIFVSYAGSEIYSGSTVILSEVVSWHELIDSWILIGTEEDGHWWNVNIVAATTVILTAAVWLMVWAGYGDLWWGVAPATLVAAFVALFWIGFLGTYGYQGFSIPGVLWFYSIGRATCAYAYNRVWAAVFGAGDVLSDSGDREVDKWGLPGDPEWGKDSSGQIVKDVGQILDEALIDTATSTVTKAAFIYIGPSGVGGAGTDHLSLQGPNGYWFDFTQYVKTSPLAEKLYFVFIDSTIYPIDKRSAVVDALYSNDVENIITVGAYKETIPFSNVFTFVFFEKQKAFEYKTIGEALSGVHNTWFYVEVFFFAMAGYVTVLLEVWNILARAATMWSGFYLGAEIFFVPAGWMKWAVIGAIVGMILFVLIFNAASTLNSVHSKLT